MIRIASVQLQIIVTSALLAFSAEAQQTASRPGFASLMASEAQGFERAIEPREFSFPTDHGPHPKFRTEWWYLTGHLETDSGDVFGTQVTFFRFALAPRTPKGASNWRSNAAFMTHFALTDVASQRFYHEERFARAAAGLAGASSSPLKVWLEDWHLRQTGDGTFPWHVKLYGDGFAIDLDLQQGKAPVLNGNSGLSRKSADPGNASYYYSMTRMPTKGFVEANGVRQAVSGTLWMDREWSSSALGQNQVGWDWFALQFADGTDLMYYQLRESGGGVSAESAGTFVTESGSYRQVSRSEVELTVLDTWKSPHGPRTYPAKWRLRVASVGLDVVVEPRLADQEHTGRFPYWEGAVTVSTVDGNRLGVGYVELTGY